MDLLLCPLALVANLQDLVHLRAASSLLIVPDLLSPDFIARSSIPLLVDQLAAHLSLAASYQRLASQEGCSFLDPSVAGPARDPSRRGFELAVAIATVELEEDSGRPLAGPCC